MMILVWLLTAVLVIDCLMLVLLVLVQLPKKEAGAGMAFGGAATDALFGAGSGTALTKITKYAVGIFFGITLILSVISSQMNQGRISAVEEKLKEKSGQTLPGAPLSSAPGVAPSAPSSAPITAPSVQSSPTGTAETPAATAPAASTPAAQPEGKAVEPK